MQRFSGNLTDAEPEGIPIMAKIVHEGAMSHIDFDFLSSEEIKKMAVCEVKEIKLEGYNSLYDPRMGPVGQNDICETCHEGLKTCPGHFGYIALQTPVPHPLCFKKIKDYLHIFCFKCHRLVLTQDRAQLLNLNKFPLKSRLKIVVTECVNISSCPQCKSCLPKYSVEDEKFYYTLEKKRQLTNVAIDEIFSNVRETDLETIGLDQNMHPSRLIIHNLPVAPTCVRPVVKNNDNTCDDDLTSKYADIIKHNNRLKEDATAPTISTVVKRVGKTGKTEDKKLSEQQRQETIEWILFHIHTLMDNSKGKARDVQGRRPIRCYKTRLTGKTGLIRGNMQGKRADFNGRTVVGPEALCHIDEVIIPPQIATNLTVPIRVTESNLLHCQSLVDQNKVNVIIRNDQNFNLKQLRPLFKIDAKPFDVLVRQGQEYDAYKMRLNQGEIDWQQDDKLIRDGQTIENKIMRQYFVQPGDVIERQTQNGDWLVLNRQPTLWKGSMQGKRVRILPGKTIRFALSVTAPFNADFDSSRELRSPATPSLQRVSLSKTGGLKRL
jgi:DNA-directed RNA polymerase subunit A'